MVHNSGVFHAEALPVFAAFSASASPHIHNVFVVVSGVSSDLHAVRLWILFALHASSQAGGNIR